MIAGSEPTAIRDRQPLTTMPWIVASALIAAACQAMPQPRILVPAWKCEYCGGVRESRGQCPSCGANRWQAADVSGGPLSLRSGVDAPKKTADNHHQESRAFTFDGEPHRAFDDDVSHRHPGVGDILGSGLPGGYDYDYSTPT